jgi:prepilin peptidase CpaA
MTLFGQIPLSPIALPVKAILLILVIVAAVWDIRSRRIPNWLTLSGVLAAFAAHTWLGGGVGALLSLKGLGVAMLIYFPLYALRGMGAGDVKLMAAVGALTGAGNWFGVFLFTAMIGAVIAIIVSLAVGRLKKTIWNVGYLLRELVSFRAPYIAREELDVQSSKALRLPHGMVIALGVIALLSAQALMVKP